MRGRRRLMRTGKAPTDWRTEIALRGLGLDVGRPSLGRNDIANCIYKFVRYGDSRIEWDAASSSNPWHQQDDSWGESHSPSGKHERVGRARSVEEDNMRRFVVALLATSALSVSAFAADMPVKAPAYRTPIAAQIGRAHV